MRLPALAAALFLIFIPTIVFAACPMRHQIYTDGHYEIHFDRNEILPTQFSFEIVDPESSLKLGGTIGYGSGYSTPNFGINLPCSEEDKKSCKPHSGTVYEINGKNTTFAFSPERDDNNPLLFPGLNQKFYYRRIGTEWQKISKLPMDVWYLKECLK